MGLPPGSVMWTESLRSRGLGIPSGVLASRYRVSVAPGKVTMLWTDLALITSVVTWLTLKVTLLRGGVLQCSVLSRKLNPSLVLLCETLSRLKMTDRTLGWRTWTELLLTLPLPSITLQLWSMVSVGLVVSVVVLLIPGVAKGRRSVTHWCLVGLHLNTGKLIIYSGC